MDPINKLLLVEDDSNDAVLTERKIKRSKIDVGELVLARSLAEARSLLAAHPIDIVFLDLNLGNESRGLDTLDAVRPAYGGVLIVITSIDDEAVGIEAIKRGADDYLVKGRLTEERLRNAVSFAQIRHAGRRAYSRIDANLGRLAALITPGG